MSLIPLLLSTTSHGRRHQPAVWLRNVTMYALSPEPLAGTNGPCLSLTKKEGY